MIRFKFTFSGMCLVAKGGKKSLRTKGKLGKDTHTVLSYTKTLRSTGDKGSQHHLPLFMFYWFY